MNKTVAERLRETADNMPNHVWCTVPTSVGLNCYDNDGCKKCHEATVRKLADMIEAEQAELRSQGVDLAALDLLCDKLDCGDEKHRSIAEQIRKAMNRTERLHEVNREVDVDALLKVADEMSELVDVPPYKAHPIHASTIRNWRGAIRNALKCTEPEVLDADGVPIKVGDTVYGTGREQHVYEVIRLVANPNNRFNVTCKDMNDQEECLCDSSMLTHCKPDTQEAIDADAAKRPCQYFGTQKCRECPQGHVDGSDVDYDECCIAQIRDLLKRQRKLMGSE